MYRKRAEVIADRLEERVFAGAYSDGDRLDEVSLASEFRVSRTPVREALQRLVAAHLAEQVPRRGVFVRQPGPALLADMFETMAELEAACGHLAATRISEEQVELLIAANVRCAEAVSSQDAQAYAVANEQFHAVIYAGTGNGFLAGEATRLFRRLKPFRRVQLQLRGRMAQSLQEHDRIITALRDRRQDCVATALRRHVGPQGLRFYPDVAQLAAAQ